MHRWILAMRPHLGRLVAAQVLLMGASAASLGGTALVRQIVDVDVPAKDVGAVWRDAALLAGCVVVGAVAAGLARVVLEAVAQATVRSVKESLFGHLLALDLAFHDDHPPGRLVSRVSSDPDAVKVFLAEVVLQLPMDVVTFAGLLALLGYWSPVLGGTVVAVLPFAVALLVWFRGVAADRVDTSRELSARLSGFLVEFLRTLPVVRSLGRAEWLLGRAAELQEQRMWADIRMGMLWVWLFNGLYGIRSVTLAAVLGVGAWELSNGRGSLGVLLVGLDVTRKLFEPFLRLQQHLSALERARVGVARVASLFEVAPTLGCPPDPAPCPELREELRYDSVSFGYPGGPAVVEGVSFGVPAGSRVALVGPTGSGKSTLLQILFRFRAPQEGRVVVDGVDLSRVDPAAWRRRLGLVQQSVQLLPGTVAENLGVDEARAEALLAEVGLGGRLRADSRVGAGGEALSRGEAQLLCLARALATDPRILVLDEATASLDPATEARIAALLAKAPVEGERGMTVVGVAHRLRSIAHWDQIVVLDAGRVVEVGTHDQLLAAQGRYAALWREQLALEAA